MANHRSLVSRGVAPASCIRRSARPSSRHCHRHCRVNHHLFQSFSAVTPPSPSLFTFQSGIWHRSGSSLQSISTHHHHHQVVCQTITTDIIRAPSSRQSAPDMPMAQTPPSDQTPALLRRRQHQSRCCCCSPLTIYFSSFTGCGLVRPGTRRRSDVMGQRLVSSASVNQSSTQSAINQSSGLNHQFITVRAARTVFTSCSLLSGSAHFHYQLRHRPGLSPSFTPDRVIIIIIALIIIFFQFSPLALSLSITATLDQLDRDCLGSHSSFQGFVVLAFSGSGRPGSSSSH